MRIVKLSKDDGPLFATLAGVRQFFQDELQRRTPRGRFNVTTNRIKQDGLIVGEHLVFVYQARVVGTALTAGDLQRNDDEERSKYPHYFVVGLTTFQNADADFYEVERLYRVLSNSEIDLVRSRGWNAIPDRAHAEAIWALLGRESPTPEASDLGEPPPRQQFTTSRVVRDTALAQRVKAMHGYRCQVCGQTIELPDGTLYAEAHHIRPLGSPHDGPDVGGNILCVCPNHHAELDFAARAINPGELRTTEGHTVDPEYVRYHNEVLRNRWQGIG